VTGEAAIRLSVFLGVLAAMLVAKRRLAPQGVGAKGKPAEPAPVV